MGEASDVGGPARSGDRPPGGAARPHPLLVTADPDLLDDLLRLCAEVGLVPDVAPDPGAARPRFDHASLVLIGIDRAAACVRSGLSRRGGVIVVGGRLSPDDGSAPDWRIAEALGAEYVAMLPAAEPWLLDRLAGLAGIVAGRGVPGTGVSSTGANDAGAGQIGKVVAVLGGRGGAGASVFAGGLAVTASRRGMRTLLVDADPLGGGIDLVLGWESLAGLRWPALSQTSGRVHPPTLVEALPGRAELVILSWDRGEPVTVPPEAMLAALDAGRRGRDLVVVDLPRRIDESAAVALRAADQAFLVVPAELRACAAAARVAATVTPFCPHLALVVRQPGPGGLRVREVTDSLGLPLAGTLRREPRLAAALERGEPPANGGRGSLATLCDKLISSLVDAQRRAA